MNDGYEPDALGASLLRNPAEAGGMTSPLDGTQLTADFTDSAPSGGGVVAGSSGCNTYSASSDDNGGDLCRLLAALP